MFNVVEYTKPFHYVQSFQNNPIEWQVVTFRKGQWHAQTHRFRCREYFNDIVAKKYKRVYTVYGFNASPVRHKKDGVDVLVHNIKDMDSFLDNLEIINDKIFVCIYTAFNANVCKCRRNFRCRANIVNNKRLKR